MCGGDTSLRKFTDASRYDTRFSGELGPYVGFDCDAPTTGMLERM